MEPGAVGGFALAALLIELTPGPNMAWLAVVAASTGRWAGAAASPRLVRLGDGVTPVVRHRTDMVRR